MQATSSTFLRYHDPIEIFMGGDRNIRSDVIFYHPELVGWVYVENEILQKAFLHMNILNFRDMLKTSVVAVGGSCYSPPPIKVDHCYIFSDTFHFSREDFHDIFPSVKIENFFQDAHQKIRYLSQPNGWLVPRGILDA